MKYKKCPKCKLIKIISDFYFDNWNKRFKCWCKECERNAIKNWRKRYPIKALEASRRNRLQYKMQVLNYYSKGNIKCKWCKIKDIDVLNIDHINNNGSKDRFYHKRMGYGFYCHLVKANFPKGYQVLCANCNLKKEILRRRKLMQLKLKRLRNNV